VTVPRYPVVVFDLDGTLLRETSVSLFLAERMGHGDVASELDQRFRAHEISNNVVADALALWFEGQDLKNVWEQLESAPWIGGMEEALRTLAETGHHLLLGTITWRFAAEMLQHRHGFDDVCGTEMGLNKDALSGKVSRYFDEWDKLRFVEQWCTQHGYRLGQVAAVGDSRSDVPLFERVGLAIALNATPDARAVADQELDTEDLRDVLPLLLNWENAATSVLEPLEREAKLLLPQDAKLPSLDSSGTLVTAERPERLFTTYWDTPDRLLARRGESLRNRRDGMWTAKHRGEMADLILVRPERHYEGDGSQPPTEAMAFLELTERAADMLPVVRLVVERERQYVRAPDTSNVLLDVIDDDVEVLGPDGSLVGRFREVELEVVHPDGDRVLTLLLKRIAGAGIEPAKPMSKYERALALLVETL
jgi:phosphoserine phosphatase